MKHYSKEELELFRNGHMSVLSRIGCSAHLKTCPECAGLLEELKKEDQFLAELRTSVQLYQSQQRKEHAK
jgi:anti-sigma factor RsiW